MGRQLCWACFCDFCQKANRSVRKILARKVLRTRPQGRRWGRGNVWTRCPWPWGGSRLPLDTAAPSTPRLGCPDGTPEPPHRCGRDGRWEPMRCPQNQLGRDNSLRDVWGQTVRGCGPSAALADCQAPRFLQGVYVWISFSLSCRDPGSFWSLSRLTALGKLSAIVFFNVASFPFSLLF